MAGRPRRRARLEAAEAPQLPEFPEPPKPLTEMTAAERAAYMRQLRRAVHDDEARQGRRPPKTMRETEIWREGLVARGMLPDARAESSQAQRPANDGDPGSNG